MTAIDLMESARLELQGQLDSAKTQTERNRLGQFATPTALAIDILSVAKSLLSPKLNVRFLDPAIGTGSFYSALLKVFPSKRIANATGYEIDKHHARQAIDLWSNELLDLKNADFTTAVPPDREDEKANLLICNPPYVRHHHLPGGEKLRLQSLTKEITGISLSGLAGLYCYFMCLSPAWLARDGLAGWLVPSEFMDVNYGQQVKEFLLKRVTLLRIHRFNPQSSQFDDALVSSSMVWFRNAVPPKNHMVEFSYGGSLLEPEVVRRISSEELRGTSKWTKFPLSVEMTVVNDNSTKLSDLFYIKRGLATGANDFFILSPDKVAEHDLPREFLVPILSSPRYLASDEIEADEEGEPMLDRTLYLLSCDLPEAVIKERHPSLWKYLQLGVERGLHKRYLCQSRTPWYSQEKRPPAALLCTYMGRRDTPRGKPFRFILNRSKATAANVYLMLYPKLEFKKTLDRYPDLLRELWRSLNNLSPEALIKEGRVYGGGLHKLEPKELGNISVNETLIDGV
jgi:adenine-specific DNA-methyltransferase